jgi:hypothetical protein
VIDEYVAHRLERERQVLDAVASGDRTTSAIVARLYPDLIDELVPRARQTVHAHLRKLTTDGRTAGTDVDDIDAEWSPVP